SYFGATIGFRGRRVAQARGCSAGALAGDRRRARATHARAQILMGSLNRSLFVAGCLIFVLVGTACCSSSSSPSSPSPRGGSSPTPAAKMSDWVEYHGNHGRAGRSEERRVGK